MCRFVLVLLEVLAGWVGWCLAERGCGTAGAQEVEPLKLHMARPLDEQGKLIEALPLYKAQAEKSLTNADRLRLAGALLRAGRQDEAKAIYNSIAAEKGSVEHHADQTVHGATLCASSLLLSGFPTIALEYARQAADARHNDPSIGLLTVRALAAAGDGDGARALLPKIAHEPSKWVVGQRLELARWYLLTGDSPAAHQLLNDEIAESVGQMFRLSILANATMRDRNWQATSTQLAGAERLVPSALGQKHVDRSWRNTQRELWSVYLRHALSSWEEGKHDLGERLAAKAQASDEEPVRSAAVVLLIAADVTHARRPDAIAKLKALGGHDLRFAAVTADMAQAIATGNATGEQIAQFRTLLAAEDQSADFVTTPLFEILADAVRTKEAH